MEKICGPFDGFYVVVYVRDLSQLGTSFFGQYKICLKPPDDFFGADFVRGKCVEGVSSTPDEALELAVQLARLQIGHLRHRLGASARRRRKFRLPGQEAKARSFDPTMPCPL